MVRSQHFEHYGSYMRFRYWTLISNPCPVSYCMYNVFEIGAGEKNPFWKSFSCCLKNGSTFTTTTTSGSTTITSSATYSTTNTTTQNTTIYACTTTTWASVIHTLQPLCDLSATNDFHQSQRSQQGPWSVPARLQRSQRQVGGLAATKSVVDRFLNMLKNFAATDLVADRSRLRGRRPVPDMSATTRRLKP